MHKELTAEEMVNVNGGSQSQTDTLSVGHTLASAYDDGHGHSGSGSISVGVEVSVTREND